MTRTSFHFRTVEGSKDLQKVVAALKDRPHTTWEGIMACNIAAFPACVSEVNHNDGYKIGRVMRMEGKKQVHTYVLLQAPGWSPKWSITPDKKIVMYDRKLPVWDTDEDDATPSTPRGEGRGEGASSTVDSALQIPHSPLLCKNPACRKPITRTLEDPLKTCCDDECSRAWKESIFGKEEGRLF